MVALSFEDRLANVLDELSRGCGELDLRFNYLGPGDDGVVAIAKVLKTNSSLTKLNLTGSGVGAKGAAALVCRSS